MAASTTTHLGVAHPTVVPENFRRADDDEVTAEESGEDGSTPESASQ
ncbi:hypothetical protein [Halobellus ordinarius]|nr:hypothetical protein [Halobellus sp. ZY16]